MSGYRVTHSSAAGRFAEGEPGPEGIHQVRLLVRTLVEYPCVPRACLLACLLTHSLTHSLTYLLLVLTFLLSTRQDSAELTVVILMARRNVADGTGANRVWALEQAAG